jgi:glutathione S-transferase
LSNAVDAAPGGLAFVSSARRRSARFFFPVQSLQRVYAGAASAVGERAQGGVHTMILLYHAPMSRSTRVLWLLEELAADYELKAVSIRRPDGSGGPDPNNPHPLKQVPAIDHDGVIIVESLAIWLHLTDSFPRARLAPGPGDRRRAEYLGWMGAATAIFEPLVTTTMSGEPFSGRQQAARAWLDQRFEAALGRTPYLLGMEFSTADLVHASLLRFFPSVLPDRPAYREWLARVAARAALVRVREIESALTGAQAVSGAGK